MFKNILPIELIYTIYSYDDTYKIIYENVIEEIKIRNSNLQKIQIFKYFIFVLLNIMNVENVSFNIEHWVAENLYFKKLYDCIIKELNFIFDKEPDPLCVKELYIWFKMCSNTYCLYKKKLYKRLFLKKNG
jgi:hypothetical protein